MFLITLYLRNRQKGLLFWAGAGVRYATSEKRASFVHTGKCAALFYSRCEPCTRVVCLRFHHEACIARVLNEACFLSQKHVEEHMAQPPAGMLVECIGSKETKTNLSRDSVSSSF